MKRAIHRFTWWLLICLFIGPLPLWANDRTLTFSTVRDASFKGPVIDVITQVYQKLGIQIMLAEFSTQRSLMEAGQGLYDGELFRIKSVGKDYPDLIMVDIPCYQFDVFIYLIPEKRFPVNGWESVPAAYTMAAPFGIRYIEQVLATRHIQAFFIKTPESALGFLLSGKADFTVSTEELDGLLVSRNLDKKVIRLFPAVDKVRVFHYLHKKNAALVPKVRKVLRQMHEDGSLKAIALRWNSHS